MGVPNVFAAFFVRVRSRPLSQFKPFHTFQTIFAILHFFSLLIPVRTVLLDVRILREDGTSRLIEVPLMISKLCCSVTHSH